MRDLFAVDNLVNSVFVTEAEFKELKTKLRF